jgi:hypothetical protein
MTIETSESSSYAPRWSDRDKQQQQQQQHVRFEVSAAAILNITVF